MEALALVWRTDASSRTDYTSVAAVPESELAKVHSKKDAPIQKRDGNRKMLALGVEALVIMAWLPLLILRG